MIWKKYTIETTNEAVDIVSSVIFDNGIVGVEIEDNKNLSEDELNKMFVDLPLTKIDNGISKVSFFVSIDDDNSFDKEVNDSKVSDNSYKMSGDNIFTSLEFNKILESIKEGLIGYKDFVDMGSLQIVEESLDDKVFLNKWKENFKKINIDDVTIVPSWEKDEMIDGEKIIIEPGSAFGTGQHETTKICVRAIKKLSKILNKTKDSYFLDIGCGSGILSLVAKKLGFKNIYLIDIDKDIEDNLRENILLNFDNVNDFKFYSGNIIVDNELKKKIAINKYDIIVANILAPVIISLLTTANISEYIKKDGYFVCSGIIKEKEEEVVSAIKNVKNLEINKILRENAWVGIICRKC